MPSVMESSKHQAVAGPPQAQDVTELNSVLLISEFIFSEAAVRAYLENRSESGGGPVDSVHQLNYKTWVVRFHTHQDAVNAVSRQTHEVDTKYFGRQPLSVFLYDEQSGSLYSGHNALHWEQGKGRKQTVDIPRVDPQAPDTVLVSGILFGFGCTADSIKADIERLGTGTHAVKSVRYVEYLGLAFVVSDDPNGARTVADKRTCKLTSIHGSTRTAHLFLYRGTLAQHADVTQTASTPGIQQARGLRQGLKQQAVEVMKTSDTPSNTPPDTPCFADTPSNKLKAVLLTDSCQWRQQLSTLDLSHLETLAHAGTLTGHVKDTLTRRAGEDYRQQLVARCEVLISDTPLAQALLSLLSPNAERQRSGDTRTASGQSQTERAFCDIGTTTDNLDIHRASGDPQRAFRDTATNTNRLDTHRASGEPERACCDTATNTDRLDTPGTSPSSTPGASPSFTPWHFSPHHTLVKFTDQSTDPRCKDIGNRSGPCEVPGGSLTALPVESPGTTLSEEEEEEEEFYDCVEELDLATAGGSVHSHTGDTHPAAVEAELMRIKEELRQFQSEVVQQVTRLQSEVTDPQSGLRSAVNRQQNQYTQLQALVMRGNERIRSLVNGLQDALGQHGHWSQDPGRADAGGALVVENRSTSGSTRDSMDSRDSEAEDSVSESSSMAIQQLLINCPAWLRQYNELPRRHTAWLTFTHRAPETPVGHAVRMAHRSLQDSMG